MAIQPRHSVVAVCRRRSSCSRNNRGNVPGRNPAMSFRSCGGESSVASWRSILSWVRGDCSCVRAMIGIACLVGWALSFHETLAWLFPLMHPRVQWKRVVDEDWVVNQDLPLNPEVCRAKLREWIGMALIDGESRSFK